MEQRISKKVIVTSGPTRAYVDSIRYFSNTSTGALGATIVDTLLDRNIPVIHIYGTGSITPKNRDNKLLESIEIVTVDDLIEAVKRFAVRKDIKAVIHSMAVLDYAPESKLLFKKKSGYDFWDIRLVSTPKVIGIMRYLLPDAYFAGFKLESGISEELLVERAGDLLKKYLLDIVIANDLEHVREEHHEALFVGKDGNILTRRATKKEIAEMLADYISKL